MNTHGPITSNSNKSHLYAPDLPWNVFKPEDLGPALVEFTRDHEPYFRRWAEMWYQNYQFLFGNHNIKWSHRHGFAVDYDFLNRERGFGMRAYTNLARVIVEALASFIYGNLPEWETDTMDRSSIKGKRWQKISQRMLESYMHTLCMDKEFSTAAYTYVLFGQFASQIDWRRNMGQILEIPRQQKVMAPLYSTYMSPNPYTGGLIETPTQLTDMAGQPQREYRWQPVLDNMGRQIIDKIFAGGTGVDMLTPFEYRREVGSSGMHKTKFVQRFKLMDFDEFLDYYKDLPGRTTEYKRIRPIYSNSTVHDMAVKLFMRLQFTTPPSVEDEGRRNNVFRSSLFRYKVHVIEHYDKPHEEKWPEGRMVVVANGECTHVTKPSYSTNKMDGWHPFAEAQWMPVAPSSVSTGPINDVVRKNREINVKDGLVATSVRRNMGSHLLIKNGSGLDPERMTGEPGLTHMVNDPFGVRYLHDEVPIPPVISRLREIDKEDVYESSGAIDALRGDRSVGATSGYQAKQYEEREEKRLFPARKNFEKAVETIGEKILACTKANAVQLDKAVMGYMMRKGAGEFSERDVITFMTSPLDFGVDVTVVQSSMAIKSKATHQATLMELAKGPLGQRLGMDAKVLDEFLKVFDADELRDASGPHRDRAERENEAFLDMLRLGPDTEGLAKPIVLFEDDDIIHIAEHIECLVDNFDEFRSNEMMLFNFMLHMEHHRLQKQEKEAKLMPGAATQTGPMMAAARQNALPTPQQIGQDAQMRRQMEQQQQNQQQPNPQAPQGQAQSPQAPRQPSAPGGGGGRIDPQAPSQNTPQAPAGGPG